MILENTDRLKDWLSVVLEPLCDADSSALARYVIALLKKDKSDSDLKRIMIEQLDVFLSEATTRFVERLFDAIASEEYLKTPTPLTGAGGTAQSQTAAAGAEVSEGVVDLEDTDLGISGSVTEIEAVLNASSPASSSKEFVIKPESYQQLNPQQQQPHHQQHPNGSSRETDQPQTATNNASTSNNNNNGSASINADTKPAFEHKTKDAYKNTHENNNSSAPGTSGNHSLHPHTHSHHHPHPHHHQQQQERTGVHNLVRSASPPMRSSGGLTYADKENQPRDSRRRRASLRSRSRSRSRSNERSFRRSRSRDRRMNEREKNQRQFRNKSPPGGGGGGAGTGHHGVGGASGGSRRSFDRRRMPAGNMDEQRSRFPNKNRRSHSPRSRSNSPERNARRNANAGATGSPDRSALPPVHLEAVMAQQQQQQHQRQRCRDFDEKGYCVRGETCPWDHGVNPVVFEGINNSELMMSMREYNPDAPEIWARGGGPPPGSQPPPPSVQGQGSINPFSGNARPNALMGALPSGPGMNPADYARGVGGGPMPMPFPFNPTAVTTPLQRQLIPIPVVDGSSGGGPPGVPGGMPGGVPEIGKRRFELEDTVAIADVPSKVRKVPINSRLGPRVNPNMQQHNSSLELRKVPRGLNTIAHLNNHFAKFGKIVNIQVSYEGDPEAAIVTFSTHAEANVAYRSTEAVLNNRFIKVFWHNDLNGELTSPGMLSGNGAGNTGGGRKNASQYHLHNVPAVPTPSSDSAKTSNNGSNGNNQASAGTANPLTEAGAGNSNAAATPTAAALGTETALASTAAPASMRLKLNTNTANAAGPGARPVNPAANAAIIRKKQEEQKKAMHQLANGLRKRKQELLQSYVKQMKSALELVERCDPQDSQRANTLETIKVLQATIDKLRKDVYADQDQLQAQIQQQQPPVKKTKEQQKKELLDIELELFAQQQEGNDTTAIQKRLEELQRTLSGSGGPGGSPSAGGAKAAHFPSSAGGTAPPRKRANFPEGSTRVDRRPKAIVVTGFAAEEADFVLGHFKHFGEISKHDVDRNIPQLILSYATRLNAEQAVLRGKMYKDKRLQISWAPVVATPSQPMAAPATKTPTTTASALNSTTDKLENSKQLLQSVSENESIISNDTLPELRLEDEEEDEETEDRSWRR